MKFRYLLTSAGFGAALAFTATSLAGGMGANNGMLFTAVMSSKNITHKLFQPGDPNVPHPFYKKRCMNAKANDYSKAMGFGTFWYNPKTNILLFAFTYSGLSDSPIMMHFHLGAKGVGGPIVRTICGHPPPSRKALGYSGQPVALRMCPAGTTGIVWGRYKLAGNNKLTPPLTVAAEKQALIQGKLYVNIHTCLNEAGELRGQVVSTTRH